MTRAHRRHHLVAWLILAPLLGVILFAAVSTRTRTADIRSAGEATP